MTWFSWDWAVDHREEILELLQRHAWLTLIAVSLGSAIALPLAIFAHRHRWFYGPIASVSGILYTIPSLALFAILLPYTGLGIVTAEIGLVGYTLLILIRNTVVGLDGVSAEVKESARAMGYSDIQLLWKVEMPLAAPAILAGIRIATVTVIGLVTVTVFVGEGGLGVYILQGLRTFGDATATVIGVILSVALAVVGEVFFHALERWATPWSRRRAGEGVA